MTKILVVEDERAISNLIAVNLRKAGYQVTCVYDGMAAADALDESIYDLILLDVMLPKVDGYELMSYITPLEIPVIFLTAKASVNDRVKGLRLGADDYLTKPFEIIELLARVETVLRRYHKTENILTVADLTIDTGSRTVRRGDQGINLTKKEYELLLLFVRNKNIALYRETIYERIWGGEYMGDSRTVDLHVQRMRKKIGWEQKIVTVYKVGYRLEV
ncbi:MAG: response regulator transcription factor [Lachnospiraceae bacterium]|nr:response regulator transcription factor [Lachnospiraceae bacterium]